MTAFAEALPSELGMDRWAEQAEGLRGRPDAESIAQAISGKAAGLFREVHLRQLFDLEASKSNIEKIFYEIAEQARPQDVFVFYYAGHGITPSEEPEFFLVPSNVTQLYSRRELDRGAISGSQLVRLSRQISALKQVFLIDACGSGGLREAFAIRGSLEQRALAQLQRSSGVFMVAATESDQVATEFETLQHGVFTYAVLEAFQAQRDNGRLTVRQLIIHLETRVPELSLEYRGVEQFPLALGSGQDFPLLLTAISVPPLPDSSPTKAPTSPDQYKGVASDTGKCTKEEIRVLVRDLGFTVSEALEMCQAR